MKNQVKIVDNDFLQNDNYSDKDTKEFLEKKLKNVSKLIKGKVKAQPKKKHKTLISANEEESSELILLSNRMLILLKLLFVCVVLFIVLFVLKNNIINI